ncbi:MAG: Nramp family divalent metal transporter [Flavobacteriales bacterium]|jgi:Mn2+/Fe2+ NRAMP family transporter|nr:Nramp family divalent metal transporter [Flavobacteriales bacterium]NCG29732.1 divalent metal cation transporter [Bacteroidota bacterium]MBT3962814.1 Nramp family divalent metal transporter [Flavobacteriales bacterium]MBT4704638.1 Nramp family divalent metal transporter [Flavobacteriales bacterium]MBT4931779.1 Nramp family divalent metal transporter [Flavobacteriales bacterium]
MSLRDKFTQFGPGLLYAGAAVGVSHLVQSTRAGAEFGFQLLGVIILVNIIKYPIFEMGPRYAAATGKSLLDGYQRIGSWATWLFLVMTVSTMFIVMAAISIVTSGLFSQLTGLTLEPAFLAIILIALSVFILGLGHYSTLDKLMKFIVILLTSTTILALGFSFIEPIIKTEEAMTVFELGNRKDILFLVALIGWMPAPIDISIWHSVWSVSKNKERGKRLPLKVSLADFNMGYWGTTFLAICFVSLGAIVMYGTTESPASGAADFASQFISLYTQNLGEWAFPFIALAAFTTMFSTLLTCLDAFPRTLRQASKLVAERLSERKFHNNLYWFWLITTAIGTSVILLFFLRDMREMVDLATTISFVLAPIFALLNYIAMNGSDVSEESKPSKAKKIYAQVSIALLFIFSTWFLFY